MMKKLLVHLVSCVIALWLSIKFIPGVNFSGGIEVIVFFGILLGLVNFFIRPLLKLILLPITIITLGLFSLVINIFVIWFVIDVVSPIEIIGFMPLFLTSVLIWVINVFIGIIIK